MRTITLALLLLPLSGLAQTRPGDLITRGSVERREYASENGRRIRITSLGNLVGLESPFGFEHIANPGGAREGYVLAYINPDTGRQHVVYNVNDLYSALLGGSRDLVPQEFQAPDSGTFAINTPVTATAVVDTADGLLRLTHELTWRAGSGKVTIATSIANRRSLPIQLRGFKRHAGIDLDGFGRHGHSLSSNWSRTEIEGVRDSGILVWGERAPDNNRAEEPKDWPYVIICRPPYCPPTSLALHTVLMTSATPRAYLAISARGDTSELMSAGYQAASDLPQVRRNERNSGTIGWSRLELARDASTRFSITYQVE